MIANRIKGLTILHYTGQCAVSVVLFWIWFLTLAYGVPGSDMRPDRYLVYSGVLVLGFTFSFLRSKVGSANLLQLNLLSNHRLTLTQTGTVLGTLLVFLFAVRDGTMSRVFVFTYFPILYICLYFSNRYFPGFLAKSFFRGEQRLRTVLLGSYRNALRLGDWIRRKAIYGVETIGLITDEKVPEKCGSWPVLGGLEDLEQVLQESRTTQLLVLEMPDSLGLLTKLNDICDRLGVRLTIVNDLEEKLKHSISFVHDDGFNFMNLRLEPLESSMNRTVKRAADIAIALPVVVFVLPPVSLFVWLAQRLQSPGPLFFKQLRTGIRGSEFEIFKFRTMHVQNHNEARTFANGDHRVYPIGRFLRRLGIDELPLFLNVLSGEMSIVGPRPHLLHHDLLFGEVARYYRVRSFIKPGITGLAQVRGLRGEARREKDLLDRIQSDLYYLENWSLVLDWFIILKTAYQIIKPSKAAY